MSVHGPEEPGLRSMRTAYGKILTEPNRGPWNPRAGIIFAPDHSESLGRQYRNLFPSVR